MQESYNYTVHLSNGRTTVENYSDEESKKEAAWDVLKQRNRYNRDLVDGSEIEYVEGLTYEVVAINEFGEEHSQYGFDDLDVSVGSIRVCIRR